MVSIAFMESGLKLIERLYNIYVLSEGRCGYYHFNFYQPTQQISDASVAVVVPTFFGKIIG